MSNFIPPTVEEIRASATVQDIDDTEIEDLMSNFKGTDDLNAQKAEAENQAFNALLFAIRSVSDAAACVAHNQKIEMLMALAPLTIELALDEPHLEQVTQTLKANRWDESDVNAFLRYCKLAPPALKFQPRTMRALLTMPPKQWIINQVIGAGDLAMVYGPPGCGKTFVVIDMIFAACLGHQFARRFEVTRPLNVAYCAGEGISGLPSRFAAAAEHYAVDDVANFTFFDTTPQLYRDSISKDDGESTLGDSIQQFIWEWQQRQSAGDTQSLDLLIVDTLHSATAGADENSAQHMGIVLKLAKQAAQDLGCAVLLVHHTNKNGTAERGSSALRGAMDCMIEVKRISETGTKAIMSCAKLKDGEGWKDQTFDLVESAESVRVWWDEPNKDGVTGKSEEARQKMLAFMQSQKDKKFTAKILAEVAGTSQSQAIKILAKMVNSGECINELMDTSKSSNNRNPLTYKVNLL